MKKNDTLKFEEQNLFNNKILHQYDRDGQLGFLGYLLRNEHWRIIENSIEFIEINSNEKIQEKLEKYNKDVEMNNLIIKKMAIENAVRIGIPEYRKQLDEEVTKAGTLLAEGAKWCNISKSDIEDRTNRRNDKYKDIR